MRVIGIGLAVSLVVWISIVTPLVVRAEESLRRIYEGKQGREIAGIEIDEDGIEVFPFQDPADSDWQKALRIIKMKPLLRSLKISRPLLRPGQRLASSENGSHLGRLTYRLSQDGTLTTTFEFLVDHRPTWQITIAGPTNFLISDNGITTAAITRDIHHLESSRISFFDSQGNEIGSVDQPYVLKAGLASDGSRLVVNTSDGVLLVFDRRGQLLYKLPYSYDFRVSTDGRTVAAFTSGEVIIYRDSHRIARILTETVARDAAMSSTGDEIAIVDARNMQLYSIKEGFIRFKKRTISENVQYRSVALSTDGKRLLAGQLRISEIENREQPGKAEARVLSLNSDGLVQDQQLFSTRDWTAVSPSVSYFADGMKALVVDKNSVYELDISAPPNAFPSGTKQ